MLATLVHLALASVPSAAPPAGPAPAEEERFPASTALAEAVSPDALAELRDLVQGFVDAGEVVGAELLVVKNGRSVLHEAFGWRDRDAETPMEVGSVFCVRSMTKPVVGTAVRMLVEDGVLDLRDRIADHLPSFDAESTREITVEQLLTHTSGLPMSRILARDPRSLESVRAVADLGGGVELAFEPGSGFLYSDQGVDTLTALIEVVTGAPAEDFVRARVLEPLGMRDSACVMAEGHPLRARASSKYAGSPGSWTRFWGPDEPPLFPVFLGSQGLYSTVEDYARFLALWLDRGRVGGERLLRRSSVRRTLTPGPFPPEAPTGFPGLRVEYGSLVQLWTRPAGEGEGEEREVVVFGHNGSDGTHAWAFPEEDAMVLYFTQSRGTDTGLRVEEQLGELLLGVPFDPIQAAPPLEEYLGYYREDEDDLYRAVVRDGDGLALEILGKAVVPLAYVGDDRWKLVPQPRTVIAFDRSEAGAVTGYHIDGHRELRFEPSSELPSAEEVAARVREAHGMDRLAELGAVRLRSRLALESLDLTGESTAWLAWPDRWRADEAVGPDVGRMAFDGEHLLQATGDGPPRELGQAELASLRASSALARFGDWGRWYPRMQVVQRLARDGEDTWVVRAGDTSGPAPTLYVDVETGVVGRVDTVALLGPGGRMGQRTSFGDFRDVSGVLLPFRTEVELANRMIGTVVATVEEVDLGVALPDGLFELRDE